MKHYVEKFQKIKDLLNKNNPIIIEIGAHYGEDTLRFLEIFPNAKIHCFEPDDRNINIFNQMVNDDRVVLYQSALSNQNSMESGNNIQPDQSEGLGIFFLLLNFFL